MDKITIGEIFSFEDPKKQRLLDRLQSPTLSANLKYLWSLKPIPPHDLRAHSLIGWNENF